MNRPLSEADEVALAMLPQYLEYKKSLPWFRQGHSARGVINWVRDQLSETESYVVMDAVADALKELVFPNGGPSPY